MHFFAFFFALSCIFLHFLLRFCVVSGFLNGTMIAMAPRPDFHPQVETHIPPPEATVHKSTCVHSPPPRHCTAALPGRYVPTAHLPLAFLRCGHALANTPETRADRQSPKPHSWWGGVRPPPFTSRARLPKNFEETGGSDIVLPPIFQKIKSIFGICEPPPPNRIFDVVAATQKGVGIPWKWLLII